MHSVVIKCHRQLPLPGLVPGRFSGEKHNLASTIPRSLSVGRTATQHIGQFQLVLSTRKEAGWCDWITGWRRATLWCLGKVTLRTKDWGSWLVRNKEGGGRKARYGRKEQQVQRPWWRPSPAKCKHTRGQIIQRRVFKINTLFLAWLPWRFYAKTKKPKKNKTTKNQKNH